MPRAILFDFDFTLADSSDGVIDCFAFAFARLGLPAVPPEAVRRTIGRSLAPAFRSLVDRRHHPRVDDFLALFRERAGEVMVRNTRLLPGVASVVDRLRERGVRLAIVSTKRRVHIEPVLQRHGLQSSFDVIMGGDDVESHKPDPEGLIAALDRLSIPAADAWYVGDTVIDAETAARAGVSFTAVVTGPTPRDDFLRLGVTRVLDDLAGLFGVLSAPDAPAV